MTFLLKGYVTLQSNNNRKIYCKHRSSCSILDKSFDPNQQFQHLPLLSCLFSPRGRFIPSLAYPGESSPSPPCSFKIFLGPEDPAVKLFLYIRFLKVPFLKAATTAVAAAAAATAGPHTPKNTFQHPPRPKAGVHCFNRESSIRFLIFISIAHQLYAILKCH